MNANQPYEVGLNYVNINGSGPFVLGPDLVAAGLSRRCGPSGNFGGGTVASGGTGSSFTSPAANLWGCLSQSVQQPGIWASTNAGAASGGFSSQAAGVIYAGILTWLPGSANAGATNYFYYTQSSRTFTLDRSITTVTGDAFIVTTVYGQCRWRLKQLSLTAAASSTVTMTDTKGGGTTIFNVTVPNGPPVVMGPTDANNGLCETINFGYGLKMTVSAAVSGSAAIEAIGPLWATGDSLAG